MALHFVGFKHNDRYWAAVKTWGKPDFFHRRWDVRALKEIAEGDKVVFAGNADAPPSPYCHDDSNEPDDPAAKERGSSLGLDTAPRVDR